jgi:hypothetical protein
MRLVWFWFDVPDFNLIRQELHQLPQLPPWGRAQGDQWDRLSNFIYRVKTWRGMQSQARAVATAAALPVEAFEAYAVRRWFNHHTHDQILAMFLAQPQVQAEPERRHHTIDFYLRGLPFDLKISLFPRAYPESLDFAQAQPHHLAHWLYQHQSKQGRYHTGNRLFIILHHLAQPELSWQLRRDFVALERRIGDFVARPILLGLTVTDPQTQQVVHPWSALIFHVV